MNENTLPLNAETTHACLLRRWEAEKNMTVRRIAKGWLSVVGTIFWFVVWIGSAIDYFGRDYATFNPKNIFVYVAAILVAVLPFRLFRPQRVLERPYEGILREIRVIEEFRRTSRVSGYNIETRLDLHIEDTSGKTHTVRVRIKPGIRQYYVVGEPLSFFPDTRFPVRHREPPFGNEADRLVFCPCCGSFEPYRYTKCFECSRPLWNKRVLDDDDIRKTT